MGQVQRTTDHEAERVLLVVVDDSDEMPVALHFACRRAEHADGRVALFYVPAKADFQHWMAVGDLMREEAREVGEEILQRPCIKKKRCRPFGQKMVDTFCYL